MRYFVPTILQVIRAKDFRREKVLIYCKNSIILDNRHSRFVCPKDLSFLATVCGGGNWAILEPEIVVGIGSVSSENYRGGGKKKKETCKYPYCRAAHMDIP